MLAKVQSSSRAQELGSAPDQIARNIALRMRGKRRELKLSQADLAEKSGVSLGSLKRFEHDALISLDSLIKLSVALGCAGDFAELFVPQAPEPEPAPVSLEEMVAQGHMLLDQIAVFSR